MPYPPCRHAPRREYATAFALLHRGPGLLEQKLGRDFSGAAPAFRTLAAWHSDQGDTLNAEQHIRRSIAIQERTLSDCPPSQRHWTISPNS